jgi:hypothetical protein
LEEKLGAGADSLSSELKRLQQQLDEAKGVIVVKVNISIINYYRQSIISQVVILAALHKMLFSKPRKRRHSR